MLTTHYERTYVDLQGKDALNAGDEHSVYISRLGVGAAAPPAASAGRDASKLRHRLIKTSQKTKRSPELPFSPDLDSGDDEEKGVPRKRMKRVDPFMYGNKRSKVHKCEREAAQKAEPSPC